MLYISRLWICSYLSYTAAVSYPFVYRIIYDENRKASLCTELNIWFIISLSFWNGDASISDALHLKLVSFKHQAKYAEIRRQTILQLGERH